MICKRRRLSLLSLLTSVALATSCGGKSEDSGAASPGKGDGDAGDGDGDAGDGDGEVASTGGTGGAPLGTGGDASDGGSNAAGGSIPRGSGGSGGSPSGGDTGAGGEGSGGEDGTPGATLGEPCPAPGALACDESDATLALSCGDSGHWEIRENCTDGDVCDPNPGDGLATCRTPIAGCDTGSCLLVDDECPDSGPDALLCADDACGMGTDACIDDACEHAGQIELTDGTPKTVRLPTTNLCSGFCDTPTYTLAIELTGAPGKAAKVTVGPGWSMATTANQCAAPHTTGCLILPPKSGGDTWHLVMIPDPRTPVVRNVVVEAVEPEATCD